MAQNRFPVAEDSAPVRPAVPLPADHLRDLLLTLDRLLAVLGTGTARPVAFNDARNAAHLMRDS